MVLRVSQNSTPGKVAGAIAARLKEDSVAQLEAVGAGAVNQAVKAISIARGYISPNDLVAVPSFSDTVIDGHDRTAIHFTVELRDGIDR